MSEKPSVSHAPVARRHLLTLLPAAALLLAPRAVWAQSGPLVPPASDVPPPAGATPPPPAAAANPPVIPAGAAYADVKRIQDYLNGIRTLQSRFQQVAGDGGVATGTIYLQRPGRMRIVYDPPVPVLIVADGTDNKIWYYDQKLDQISWTNVEDTPAWFLLQDNLALGGGITVTSLDRNPGALRITLVEAKNPGIGHATLVLSDKPLELRKWQVTDAQQKTVSVTLDNPVYGGALNPNLFYWTDPRPSGGR